MMPGEGSQTYADRTSQAQSKYPPERELIRLGDQLFEHDRIDDALKVFTFYREAFPDSWTGYDRLGKAFARLDKPTEAIACYRKSLVLNPSNEQTSAQIERLSRLLR